MKFSCWKIVESKKMLNQLLNIFEIIRNIDRFLWIFISTATANLFEESEREYITQRNIDVSTIYYD